MGSSHSKEQDWFLEAILCGQDGKVAKYLKKNPELAKCEFFNGTTNPVCRATYLGHRNILSLILKYGADINKRSSDQRTPVIWAAFRDNVQMLEFLKDNGADMFAVDKDGYNALDIAIIRINYQAARFLTKYGL